MYRPDDLLENVIVVKKKNNKIMFVTYVYAASIFISAGLLFFIQPLAARLVLPHLGGSASVWTAAMLFFQFALLAGYAYAHFLCSATPATVQTLIHMAIWSTGLFFLPIALPGGWAFDPNQSPALSALTVFAITAGIPFFVLSANAPLLQKWYAATGVPAAADPYHLYAASNVGSIAALLAYPLVVDPLMGSAAAGRFWSAVYIAFGAALLVCAIFRHMGPSAQSRLTADRKSFSKTSGAGQAWKLIGITTICRWTGLAFVPASLMVGVTQTISNEIGAFPLIWVVPLALYLLTFVFAFSTRINFSKKTVNCLFLIPGALALAVLPADSFVSSSWLGPVILLVALFGVGLWFHTNLHDRRPPESGLTVFYFCMSGGGFLGGLFNCIIAPLVFDSFAETLILFFAAIVVFVVVAGAKNISAELRSLKAAAIISLTVVGAFILNRVVDNDALLVAAALIAFLYVVVHIFADAPGVVRNKKKDRV